MMVACNRALHSLLCCQENENTKALTMHKTLIKVLSNFKVLSITCDNDLENALRKKTNKALGCKPHFCKLYYVWEEGSKDNRNGALLGCKQLSHHLPKSTNFNLVTQGCIGEYVEKINNKPMKCLGFKIPREAQDSMTTVLCD